MVPQTTETDDPKLNPGQVDSDRKFNDIAAAEARGNFDDGANNKTSGATNSDTSQDVRDAESTPGGWQTNLNPSKRGTQPVTIKGILKRKGATGLIILLVGGGALAFGGLFSGAGLLITLAENLKGTVLGSTASVMDIRGRKIMQMQLSNLDKATNGLCTPISIRCRFSTMGDRQIRLLSEAGVDINKGSKAIGINRTKVTELMFEGKTYTADTLKAGMKENPKLTQAINKSYNSRLVSFSSSAFNKVLASIGSTKAANLPKTSLDKMKQAMVERVSGLTQATADARLTPEKDPQGKPTGGYLDEFGHPLTAAQGEVKMAAANSKFKTAMDIKKKATSTTEFFSKGSVKASLVGVGAVALSCSAWNLVRTAAAASRYLGAIQLANYAMVFVNTADSIKAGDATPEQVEYLGTILTTPNKEGVAAMDSRGIKNVLYGDTSPIPDPASESDASGAPTDAAIKKMNSDIEITKYVNGAAVNDKSMNTILENIPGVASATDHNLAYKAADEACGYINSTVGVGLMLGTGVLLSTACFVSAFFTVGATGGACVADLAVQATFFGALYVIVTQTNDYLASMFSNTLITGNENGNQAGNAVASGAHALDALNGLGSGLGLMSKSDAGAFKAFKDDASAEFAATDRLNYGPLDASNPNTFIGKMALALTPYLSKVSSLSGSLSSISQLPLASFSSLFHTTTQATSPGDAGVCTDVEYADYATDINCNPLVGQTQQTLDIDAEPALDYMINNKHVDEMSGAALSADYKDYITYCAERKTAFGTYPEGQTLSDLNTGKVCRDGYTGDNGEMYGMFRAYTSYMVAEEGLNGPQPSAPTPADPTTANTSLPDGTEPQLATMIINSGNVTDTTGQLKQIAAGTRTNVASGILQVIASLAKTNKFTISSLKRDDILLGNTKSTHLLGMAVDISGNTGINGVPFGYNGINPTLMAFLNQAAATLPENCGIGVPNQAYFDAIKSKLKKGCVPFVDLGTGAHTHLDVMNRAGL